MLIGLYHTAAERIVVDGRRLPELVCNSQPGTSELSSASSNAQY